MEEEDFEALWEIYVASDKGQLYECLAGAKDQIKRAHGQVEMALRYAAEAEQRKALICLRLQEAYGETGP